MTWNKVDMTNTKSAGFVVIVPRCGPHNKAYNVVLKQLCSFSSMKYQATPTNKTDHGCHITCAKLV